MSSDNENRPWNRSSAAVVVLLIVLAFGAGILVQKYVEPGRLIRDVRAPAESEEKADHSYRAPVDPRLIRAFGTPVEVYDSRAPYVYASGSEKSMGNGSRFLKYRYFAYYKQAEDYLRGSEARDLARKEHDDFWRASSADAAEPPGTYPRQQKYLKEALGVRDLPPRGRVISRMNIAGPTAYTLDKLEIESRSDGITVPLYVATPGKLPAKAVVIAVHGHSSSPENVMGMEETDYTRNFGAELAKHGYVVYAPYVFNASHYNPNFGAIGMLYSGDTKFSLDIQKLMAVVDLIKSDPKVSNLPLVLWGVSYGSRLSVYMTAIDQRIEAIVVNGGFLHHKDFLAENFSFGRENHAFVEDVLLNHALYQTFDSADLARLIAPRPMLLELPAYDLDPFPETVVEIWKRIVELYKAENAGAAARLIWFRGYHETAPAVTIPILDSVVADLRR